MKPAARNIGKRLGQFLKSFNPRSEFLTAEKQFRASGIIFAMTVAMVLLALVAWIGAEFLGQG